MYVFELEQFTTEVDARGLREKVDELRLNIDRCKSYFEIGVLFDAAIPYLKKAHGKFRFIGRVVQSGSVQVFVFCALFERKDPDYMLFMSNRTAQSARRNVERGFDQHVIDEWIRLESGRQTEKIPELPHDLYGWVEAISELNLGATREEFIIQDSDTWESSVNREFVKTNRGLAVLYQPVLEIVSDLSNSAEIGVIQRKTSGGVNILWAKYSANEICLLLALNRTPTGSEELECNQIINDEQYRNRVLRSYLSIVVYEEDLWLQVQSEDNANLLLSDEETRILNGMARMDDPSNPPMPAVISGRAGSGKSTMLAYIFAALCLKKANNGLAGRPIYVSYNPRLLETAKSVIKALLRANSNFLNESTNRRALSDICDEIDEYFFNFKDFLLSFIHQNERHLFQADKHVDFNDFKRAFLGLNSSIPAFTDKSIGQVSPERAWYVIRQFIKGSTSEIANETTWSFDVKDELDATFDELTRRDQQGVDRDQLEKIFRKVYLAWYRPNLIANDLWDDQDLVRRALAQTSTTAHDPIGMEKRITAIICDEAQDFTPREIRFMVRASTLLRYDLAKSFGTLPFVLAGDSLQTLSPTGFRWGTVTSILYEELFAVTGREMKAQRSQLKLNYRSEMPVVNFCNLIQLWRKHLFSSVAAEIEPQIAWRTSLTMRPQYYRIGENLDADHLGEALANHIVLVPCEENGEVDFVKNDELLSKLFPGASDAAPPATVFSASSAKGLEFQHVFLYKFGDQFVQDKFSMEPEGDSFGLEFFFNKLYVAASRARSSLTIIEDGRIDSTKNSADALWDYFIRRDSQDIPEDIKSCLARFPDFQNSIAFLQQGSPEAWRDTGAAPDGLHADQMFKAARNANDVSLMARASELFRRANEPDRAKECKGYEYMYKREFELAAKEFEELQRFDESWDILFTNCLWRDANRFQEKRSRSNVAETALVKFMVSPENNVESLLGFVSSIDAFYSAGGQLVNGKAWSSGQKELSRRADLIAVWQKIEWDDLSDYSYRFLVLSQRDFPDLRQIIGSFHFERGDWKSALESWDIPRAQLSEDRTRQKAVARARARGFPAGLGHLFSEQCFLDIIDIWIEHGQPMEREWCDLVANSYTRSDQHEKALSLLINLGKAEEARKSYRILKSQNPKSTSEYIEGLVSLCSSEFKFYDGIDNLISDYKAITQLDPKILVEKFIIASVELWRREKFKQDSNALAEIGFGEPQRSAYLSVLQSYVPTSDQRRLDPRWIGVAWELSLDFVGSRRFYELYVDSKEHTSVQTFARKGVLRSLIRERNFYSGQDQRSYKQSEIMRVDKELDGLRKKWNIARGAESRQEKDLVRVPKYVEASDDGGYSEDGDYGPFSWTLNKADIALVMRGSLTLFWRIETARNTCTSLDGPLVVGSDGCFRFEVENWKIEIRISRDESRISFGGDVKPYGSKSFKIKAWKGEPAILAPSSNEPF